MTKMTLIDENNRYWGPKSVLYCLIVRTVIVVKWYHSWEWWNRPNSACFALSHIIVLRSDTTLVGHIDYTIVGLRPKRIKSIINQVSRKLLCIHIYKTIFRSNSGIRNRHRWIIVNVTWTYPKNLLIWKCGILYNML